MQSPVTFPNSTPVAGTPMALAPPPSSADHTAIYNAFANNVKDLSSNLLSISKDGAEGPDGKGGDKGIASLPGVIQIVQNWLLNLTSRPDLLMGYVKRVYVNKKALDDGNGDALIDDEEYFYGDVAFARPHAPLFTRLWKRHMRADEQKRAIEFFRAYNAIVEDWIAAGAAGLFDPSQRGFDHSVLMRIAASLRKLDAVPEDKLKGSRQLKEHYALLGAIRLEFLALRGPKDEEDEEDVEDIAPPTTKAKVVSKQSSTASDSTTSRAAPSSTTSRSNGTATTKASKEVMSVSVTNHGDHVDVEAVDVKVVKSANSAKVTATKVTGAVPAPKSSSSSTSTAPVATRKR